jgi:hypothetical protein
VDSRDCHFQVLLALQKQGDDLKEVVGMMTAHLVVIDDVVVAVVVSIRGPLVSIV